MDNTEDYAFGPYDDATERDADVERRVKRIMAICGNPDPSDACRLVLRECNDWLCIIGRGEGE